MEKCTRYDKIVKPIRLVGLNVNDGIKWISMNEYMKLDNITDINYNLTNKYFNVYKDVIEYIDTFNKALDEYITLKSVINDQDYILKSPIIIEYDKTSLKILNAELEFFLYKIQESFIGLENIIGNENVEL